MLPEAPNDWHWSAIITQLDGTTTRLDFDIEGFAEGDEIDVQLFLPGITLPDSIFGVSLEVDNDSYTISGVDTGIEYHSGFWSQYPFDLPADLFSPIDAARGNFVPTPEPCPGDLNGDCIVDADDLGILLGSFGCVGTGCAGDLNGDGVVDADDLGIMLGLFGTTCDCDCDLGPCPGDLNGDGVVNLDDFIILTTNLGCVGPDCVGDLNCDGVVDDLDLELIQELFGPCPD